MTQQMDSPSRRQRQQIKKVNFWEFNLKVYRMINGISFTFSFLQAQTRRHQVKHPIRHSKTTVGALKNNSNKFDR